MHLTTFSTGILVAGFVVAIAVPVHNIDARGYEHRNAIMTRDPDLTVREVLRTFYARDLAAPALNSRTNEVNPASVKGLNPRSPPAEGPGLRRIPASSDLRAEGQRQDAQAQEAAAPAEQAGPSPPSPPPPPVNYDTKPRPGPGPPSPPPPAVNYANKPVGYGQ
ncbi:hypothetical protein EIP91_004303 [Steccherinum ochraceum]|uniref:Uncharacterized protein n=1 Tax=Steccherinum ochraceum TaxID=92696 RepID=A0A4R0RPE8_9APHY|nr:hypothetical protein EIP91_004303 [Steccherinum ochraceum]